MAPGEAVDVIRQTATQDQVNRTATMLQALLEGGEEHMAEQDQDRQAALQGFRSKLEAFSQTLTAGEREILGHILLAATASSAGDDVSGHGTGLDSLDPKQAMDDFWRQQDEWIRQQDEKLSAPRGIRG